jgi:hypothetical protein
LFILIENHSMGETFDKLETFLSCVPGIKAGIGKGETEDGLWWVKFQIDIRHPLSWSVVQEFGHVMNYLSLDEPLPTIFYPVSPPPYMNGGPENFLSWVVESKDPTFTPNLLAEWLEGRLPRPVDDLDQWQKEEE